MVVFASLSHIEHHTRGVCLFFEFHYHKNASVGLCVSYSTQYKTAVLASSVQCQHHTAIGCNQASTCRPSPRAPLHVVGMLRLMPWHKPTEHVHSFLSRSCVSFCLYGPFNCISFHTLLPTPLRFLTPFFRSYFCLIGPFNYISLYESLSQPPLWLTGLKAPTKQRARPLG